KIGQSLETARLVDAKDHWWVQYNMGGRWFDLDPDTDAKPLSRLGQGQPTFFACATNDLAAKVPADLFHTVTCKVVIERWNNGKLEEEPAIESTLKTWEHPAIHVALFHRSEEKKARPSNSLPATVLTELKEPTAIKAALLSQQ